MGMRSHLPEIPAYPVPPNESERLADLASLEVLDSAREAAYDRLVEMALALCGVPIAAVSLIDANRQWFKASIGIEVDHTLRDHAVCAHAILGSETFVVRDLSADPRFCNLPMVAQEPHLRFYAAHPIITCRGNAVGTLCVASPDLITLSDEQLRHLAALSHQASVLLEFHRVKSVLRELSGQASAPHGPQFRLSEFGRELRTSMTGIVGLADLLAAAPLPPKEREYASTIARSGRALVATFGEAIKSGGQRRALLSEAVSNAFPSLRANALARGIRLTYETAMNLDLSIEVDPNDFRNALSRRMDVLFGALGTTFVHAEISASASQVSVRLRSDGSLGGSSLGSEWRQNPAGIECQFIVERLRGRETKVLVVEDNEVNSLILSSMLSDLGCQVTSVTSAQEALKSFGTEPYSMVLTDIQMPGMDGMALTRFIREREHNRHTPIIAVTASSLGDEMDAFRECGIDDAVQKPFSEQDIANIVARWANLA